MILLVTFLLTVFADLVVAVNIGVILATLHFLRRMAESVEVRQSTVEELARETRSEPGAPLPPGVLVYTIEGPFFFGAAETFERALAGTHTDPRTLVLRLGWVPFIDITGLQTLEEVIRGLQRRGVRVLLAGANARVHAKLQKAGILALIGPGNSCDSLATALARVAEFAAEPTAPPPLGARALDFLQKSRAFFETGDKPRDPGPR